MKVCILASGSKGNSLFLETAHSRFLVDVGLSARKIEQRLASIDIDPHTINAIVLTHGHGDHVRGVGVFAKRYGLTIYGHADTLDHIAHRLKPGQATHPWSGEFAIDGAQFVPFRLSHDCDPTYGYLIRENGRAFCVCTDLGIVTDDVKAHVSQAHTLLLESNHDANMLMNGPYPWDLKDRIAGRRGHLSNKDAGELLNEIWGPQLRRVILGHLSSENNTAEAAFQTVAGYIGAARASCLSVIEQNTVSELFHV